MASEKVRTVAIAKRRIEVADIGRVDAMAKMNDVREKRRSAFAAHNHLPVHFQRMQSETAVARVIDLRRRMMRAVVVETLRGGVAVDEPG